MQAEPPEQVAYPYQELLWRGAHDVQIRILVIEPSTDLDAPIVCRLVTRYIEEYPVFEILSYTWGDPEDVVAITLEGHEISITRGLHGALKACRLRDVARRLWVDALCINQGDNGEKSNIVRNMHIFYRYATRTIIWLGQASGDSDLALEIVTRMGGDAEESTEREEELAILRSTSNGDRPSYQATTHWTALSNLFGRPYWTRTWVVQEVVYSRDAIVKCADREIPMEWFYQTCITLSDSPGWKATGSINIEMYTRLRGMRTVILMVMLRRRVQSRTDEGDVRPLRPLSTILSQLRELQVTDPRDKVYGCLMLASRPPGLDRSDVDYDQTCAKLYASVARKLIEQDSSLRVLSSCDTFGQESRAGDTGASLTAVDGMKRIHVPNLPSWAPNWAVPRVSTAFAGDYEESIHDLELLNKPQWAPEPYRASGNMKAEFLFSDDSVSVTVKGLVLDGIIDRSENPYGKHISEGFGQAIDVCKRCPNPGARYLLELEDALLVTLIGNRNSSGRRLSAEDQASIVTRAGASDSDIADRIRDTGSRIFFTTFNGYMGLGPLGTKVNDRVCLIKGCYVPMVLRRVKIVDGVEKEDCDNVTHAETSFYRVIGPAYVHGVMEGEAVAYLAGDRLIDFVLRTIGIIYET